MIEKEDFKWFVIKIKPNSCDLAVRNLKRQSFETFNPIMKVTTRKNNKFTAKKVSVFPGYIFVYFNPKFIRWQVINSTYGVSKIICFNSKPAEISTDLVLELKKRYSLKEINSENDKLQDGDLIKINTGPFTNFFAKIENINNNDRIWVLLDYAGKKHKINLKNSMNFNYTLV